MDRLTNTPADHVIDQGWERYSAAEHAVWRTLFERQMKLLPGRVCQQYMEGLAALSVAADGIPDFRRLSDVLMPATGWQVVAVPGLIPDAPFFKLLSQRKFPSGNFIRRRDQLDYLQEPDVFHDVFGHVPMLFDPVFADYLQVYGRRGLAAAEAGTIARLARLYWYTVEFGLMQTAWGLRIFGAGIVSSRTETVFSLDDPSPNRVRFDLERVMRTNYRIDDFQETYFVIDDFESLLDLASVDFPAVIERLGGQPDLKPATILPTDEVFSYGSGDYHAAKHRAARDHRPVLEQAVVEP